MTNEICLATKPPPDILELFKTEDGGKRFAYSYANGVDTLKEKPHTLEEYSIEHFRPGKYLHFGTKSVHTKGHAVLYFCNFVYINWVEKPQPGMKICQAKWQ